MNDVISYLFVAGLNMLFCSSSMDVKKSTISFPCSGFAVDVDASALGKGDVALRCGAEPGLVRRICKGCLQLLDLYTEMRLRTKDRRE